MTSAENWHQCDIYVPEKSFRLFVRWLYLQCIISWRQYFVTKRLHFVTVTSDSAANCKQQQRY